MQGGVTALAFRPDNFFRNKLKLSHIALAWATSAVPLSMANGIFRDIGWQNTSQHKPASGAFRRAACAYAVPTLGLVKRGADPGDVEIK